MLKKIINKLKQKTKEIPYGKNCQYYIDFSYQAEQQIKDLGLKNKDGRDICGYTLETEINELGNEVFKKYGQKNYCGECGMPLTDSRRPIYRKCTERNRYKKCKDYLGKN